jgi:hypothetical protein
MRILSHRGYWKTPEEKNTQVAFVRSFDLGFGTETDVRDAWGDLLVSHDPPTREASPMTVTDFCALYVDCGGVQNALPLALNIKSDGLQATLKEILTRYGITEYFVFDMSVPDTRGYLAHKLPVYTRHSEYETSPPFYAESDGVWVDGFLGDWMNTETLRTHRAADKSVCLVSPDLHKRPHLPLWAELREAGVSLTDGDDSLAICTDYPEEARTFFGRAKQ